MKQPEYIKGYWRNTNGQKVPDPTPEVEKTEKKEANHDLAPALVLIGSAAAIYAVAYWQISLVIGFFIATGYLAYKQTKIEQLKVNHYK